LLHHHQHYFWLQLDKLLFYIFHWGPRFKLHYQKICYKFLLQNIITFVVIIVVVIIVATS
jgi:hypothetical protein